VIQLLPPELEELFRKNIFRDDRCWISLTEDDLEEFLDSLAAEANHAKSKKNMLIFDRIIERIEGAYILK
jgi:hypothetical protein